MLQVQNINARIYYIKYCLLAFTVLFALTGLSLVIIGSTINAVFIDFNYFFETKYFAPAVFLYSVGFAVFGVSIVGLYGALKENPFIITAYGIFLGLIFVFQVAAGLSTTILVQGTIYDQLNERITIVMSHYDVNDQYRLHVDALQQGVGCCGIYNENDWGTMIPSSGKPLSCCGKLSSNGTCTIPYRRGCFIVIQNIINDVSNILATSAYVLAIMQLAGVCFALYLGKSLRAQQLAKQYRRWLLTNQLFSQTEKDEKEAFEENTK